MKLLCYIICLVVLSLVPLQAESTDPEKVDCGYLRVRFGEGGYVDKRSEINKLGGGEMTIEYMPRTLPVYFALSSEHYTNSPEPTHVYEIADMILFNAYYTIPFWTKGNTNLFFGGGAGFLNVPEEEGSTQYETGIALQAALGINFEIKWNLGLYAVGKYIHSSGYLEKHSVIEFNELALLIGISLNFEW